MDNNGPSAFNASMSFSSERAYEGTKSLRMDYDGAPGNVFARVWYAVDWNPGDDVWYGAAFYVPDATRLAYTDLIRWDNYGSADPETGGVLAQDGTIFVQKRNYDGTGSARLTTPVAVPEGRWFWLEVHQKLSDVSGQALTELYIDGQKVGSSTQPNSRGRKITEVRYGYVYNWDQGGASTLFMDRVSTSDRSRGPLS